MTTGANGVPVYTFATTPTSSQTVLINVHQTSSTDVFQYFSYQEPMQSPGVPYTDGAGDPYMMLLDGTSAVPGTNTIPTASAAARFTVALDDGRSEHRGGHDQPDGGAVRRVAGQHDVR